MHAKLLVNLTLNLESSSSGGQSIGVSASASVLPVNVQH